MKFQEGIVMFDSIIEGKKTKKKKGLVIKITKKERKQLHKDRDFNDKRRMS